MASTNHRKRTRPVPLWTITVEDTTGLRTILDAIGAVVSRVNFRISRIPDCDRYQLMFDGTDQSKTCCVSARLQIDSIKLHGISESELYLCVDCKQLQILLDTPTCAHAVLSMQYCDDSKVYCALKDMEQSSTTEDAEFNTYVDEQIPIEINDIEFDLKAELDVSKLREMIKKAKKIHAEHIRFTISLIQDGLKQISLITFQVKGDAVYTQTFAHETARDDSGSLCVRAASGGECEMPDVDQIPEYDAQFPVDKIDAFVRILPCRIVTTRVKPAMPLMMMYELGGGIASSSSGMHSTLKFLIAPINDVD